MMQFFNQFKILLNYFSLPHKQVGSRVQHELVTSFDYFGSVQIFFLWVISQVLRFFFSFFIFQGFCVDFLNVFFGHFGDLSGIFKKLFWSFLLQFCHLRERERERERRLCSLDGEKVLTLLTLKECNFPNQQKTISSNMIEIPT